VNYLKKTFSVGLGSDNYRANWDAVFGKKDEKRAALAEISAIGQELEAETAVAAHQTPHEHDFWPIARFSGRTMCECGAEGPPDAPGEAIDGSEGSDSQTPENSSQR
jgi:hypothetical protein